ncbi:hypothetical protein FNF27_01158 [Cafeteria roenbergensis]|uniref:EF-hand domain-containing protein n=1 Tax=Cafeteria roenbergensis TaxID=33653 RepID=A0A5A8EN73_CAFRO|nr:hypothetical protein FNF27_01158 [Cafeteria roenbergensis]
MALARQSGLGLTVPKPPTVNPFINQTPPLSGIRACTLGITGLTLLPVRLSLSVVNIGLIAVFSNLASMFLTPEDLERDPLSTVRRAVRSPIWYLMRFQLFLLGYHWIDIKGRAAPRKEAPVLIANHTSFVDPLYMATFHAAAPVSRAENATMPVIGGIIKAFQTLFVNRAGSPEERLAIKEKIGRRAADDRMPHLLIFPEATCTNGRAVISFKLGAFAPLRPVQPVTITYPLHGGFDHSWVHGGPGLLTIFLSLMTQFSNSMQVRYLPVIKPDPPAKGVAEGSTAHVVAFARKAQLAMAEAMGVPATQHSFLDVILGGEAVKRQYPPGAVVPELEAFRDVLKLDIKAASKMLEAFVKADTDKDGCLDEHEWVEFFVKRNEASLSPADSAIHREQLRSLFATLDTSESGKLDFREFLSGLAILTGRSKADPSAIFRALFRAITVGKGATVGRQQFESLARRAFPESDPADAGAAFDAARGDASEVDEEAFVAYLSKRAELVDAYRTALLDVTVDPKRAAAPPGGEGRCSAAPSARVAPEPGT